MKKMKKECEHALKKEKERNGCLLFNLEKRKVELDAIKAKEEPLIEMRKRAIKSKDEEESELKQKGPLKELNAHTDSVQFPEPEREAELNSEPVKETETGQIAEIELQPKPEVEEGVGFTGLAKPVHVEQPELKPASSDKMEEPEGSGKKKKKKKNKKKKKQLVTSCPKIK